MYLLPTVQRMFQIGRKIVPIPKPYIFNQGCRPYTKSQVILPCPVAAVMAAAKSRPGVIGNLVPSKTGLTQNSLCLRIHQPVRILIRKRKLSLLQHFPETRPLLGNQAVGRNVNWPGLKFKKRVQRPFPALRGLPGQCAHHIHIDVGKSRRYRSGISRPKLLHGMNPPDPPKFLFVRRLQADAQTVHPCCPICRQLSQVSSTRIHLHSDFRILRQAVTLSHGCKQSCQLPGLCHGGRTSPHKHRIYRIVPVFPGPRPCLLLQRLHVGPADTFLRRSRQKVAVQALFYTKRNMKIQLQTLALICHPASARS